MSLPWNQIHAKVAAAFASGVVTTFVVWLLGALGHPVDQNLSAAITTVVATVGGYLMPAGSTPPPPPSKPVIVPATMGNVQP